jgi:zinc protease
MRTAALIAAIAFTLSAQVRLPQYSRQILPNGAVLDVMPRRDVPLTTMRVVFKGGSEADPADMSGLARVTAEAIRRGTAKRTQEQFARELDSLGATFMTTADAQSVAITRLPPSFFPRILRQDSTC